MAREVEAFHIALCAYDCTSIMRVRFGKPALPNWKDLQPEQREALVNIAAHSYSINMTVEDEDLLRPVFDHWRDYIVFMENVVTAHEYTRDFTKR